MHLFMLSLLLPVNKYKAVARKVDIAHKRAVKINRYYTCRTENTACYLRKCQLFKAEDKRRYKYADKYAHTFDDGRFHAACVGKSYIEKQILQYRLKQAQQHHLRDLGRLWNERFFVYNAPDYYYHYSGDEESYSCEKYDRRRRSLIYPE